MMRTKRPLRIGIVCYPLVGGSGILATELGHQLARRGHTVHFFAYDQPVRLRVSAPRIHFHPVKVSEYALFKYPDYTLPLAVRLAEVARSERLDLWHVHYAVPHATAAFLARQLVGNRVPRILTTLHGTDTTLLGQDPNYQAAIEHALAQSDAVTTVSESLRRQTAETFRLERPIEVIHNFFEPRAAPTNGRDLRAELGLHENEVMVLHMSNLRPVKRVDLLLETVAKSRHRERLRLVILSGGSFGPWRSRLRSLGIERNVVVRENVGNVEDYLRSADFALYTSESESFGLALLESMFFETPAVAFSVGGIPEVVEDGKSGYLVPFGDVEAAAERLDELVADVGLRQRMGQAAGKWARENFSASRIVPQYEALYRRLMEAED